jgi:hypothetical protein
MLKNNYYENRRMFFAPIAGGVEAIIMQPLDTIKVLRQSNQYHGLKYHLQEPKILYKGLTPFTGQMFVKYFLRFSTFEILKSKNNDLAHNFVAGTAAGIIESLFITPFELIKTNLQTTEEKKPINLIKKIYKEKGLSGLYRGYLTTAMRQGTNQSFNFSIYYQLRKMLIPENDRPKFWQIICASSISSSIGPVITNPIDVLKTRYMNPKYNYNKISDAIVSIIKNEGFMTFYKGLGLRILRVSGGQIITFTVIENLMHYTKRN